MERSIFEASFSGANSVLDQKGKSNFKGLDYYSVDSTYHLSTTYNYLNSESSIYLNPDSTSSDLFYPRILIHFTLNGKECKLTGYSKNKLEQSNFFIPFNDSTNGVSTYGGGRFMDVQVKSNQQLVLDFNLAYNPYCAYNSNYICPVPPRVNNLDVKILAGEMIPLIENH